MSDYFYQQLTQARTGLDGLKGALAQVKGEAGAFPPDDPEPYGPDARALHATLTAAQRTWSALAQRRRELLSEAPAPAEGGLERLKAAVARPIHGVRLRREANKLLDAVDGLQAQAEDGRRLLGALQRKPLDVARCCQDLVRESELVETLAAALDRAGLHGPDLEAIPQEAGRLIDDLRQVPDYFLHGTGDLVLARATKDSTIAAWQVANEVAEPLQQRIRTLQSWQVAHGRLVQALGENGALLARIEAKMGEANRAREYPLGWGVYHDRLLQLGTLVKMAGGPETQRTSQQLADHARLVQRVREKALALDGDVDTALAWRKRLIPLLNRADLAGQPAWLAQARALIPEVGRLPPNNWPAELRVQALAGDLNILQGRLHQWVPAGVTARLLAPQLEAQYVAVRDLAPEVEAFQVRLARIAEGLAALQKREQQTRDELAACRAALSRLVDHIKDAEPALSRDLGQARRKVEAAKRDCDHAARYFERSGESLEARCKYVERRFKTHRQALQSLLAVLREDHGRHRKALLAEVEGLEDLALFDRERAMAEAKQLLADTRDERSRATGRSASPERLAAGAEALLQSRQDLYVALGNLRSQVSDPVSGPTRAYLEIRDAALARYEALVRDVRAVRAGEGSETVDTDWARRLVDMARRDEQRLEKARTVYDVRDLCGRLVKDYRNVLDEVEVQEANLRQGRRRRR